MKGFINGFCGIITGIFIVGLAIKVDDGLKKIDYVYEKEKRVDKMLSMVK